MSARTGILRADVMHPGLEPEVACALELTEESVFIVTDALPPIGARVELRLSLPRRIAPIDVAATVEQVRLSSGPGTPSGFVAKVIDAPGDLRELVARVSAPPPPSGAPSRPRRGVSVLLVEDSQLTRDMFTYTVEKYFADRGGRVSVVEASDAESAWEKLSADRVFDFIIVDYFLAHGSDGASLITRLRADPRFAGSSVIAVSVGGSEVKHAVLRAGADLFLRKPIVLRSLFHTLELLMAGGVDASAA